MKHKSRAQKTKSEVPISIPQRYWRRRARLLAEGKERRTEHSLKVKMAQQSCVSSFDIDIMFMKVDYLVRKARRTAKHFHRKITQQVSEALKRTDNMNCLTETDLEAAFGTRRHSSSSEPYYWEQVYKLRDSGDAIPVDENGQARIFSLVKENTKPREQPVTQHESVQHEDIVASRFITTETDISCKDSSTVELSQPTMQHSPRHNSLNR